MTTDLVLNNPWKKQILSSGNDEVIKDTIYTSENLEKLLQYAKAQIGEDKKTKEQCLFQLREWISQNRDIRNCFTDDNFLLRFLRTKKYSLFMTQQMILKYLNFRKTFSRFMEALDFQETKIQELITNGYIFASPFRDSEGRRVIIYDVSKFDLHKYTDADMGHAHTICYEAAVEDESTQLLGVNHVADLSGLTAAFATLFSVSDFTRLITWGEQSFPMRHKEINLFNVPTAVKYVYDYALSKMSVKLRGRFTIHNKLTSLTDKVDKKCLPLEMGGSMPKSEMISLWKQELNRKYDRLTSMKEMELLSDRGIISRRTIGDHTSNNNNMEGLTGSFRKLEVD